MQQASENIALQNSILKDYVPFYLERCKALELQDFFVNNLFDMPLPETKTKKLQEKKSSSVISKETHMTDITYQKHTTEEAQNIVQIIESVTQNNKNNFLYVNARSLCAEANEFKNKVFSLNEFFGKEFKLGDNYTLFLKNNVHINEKQQFTVDFDGLIRANSFTISFSNSNSKTISHVRLKGFLQVDNTLSPSSLRNEALSLKQFYIKNNSKNEIGMIDIKQLFKSSYGLAFSQAQSVILHDFEDNIDIVTQDGDYFDAILLSPLSQNNPSIIGNSLISTEGKIYFHRKGTTSQNTGPALKLTFLDKNQGIMGSLTFTK